MQAQPAPSLGPMPKSQCPRRNKRTRLNEPTSSLSTSLPSSRSAVSDANCILCQRPIGPSNEERDTWRSYHQPMKFNEGANHLPPIERCPSNGNTALIHACCWEVVWNAAGRPILSRFFVTTLTRHLIFLQSFATKTPWDGRTNDVDHELWTETPSQGRIESSSEHATSGIGISMMHKAVSWLEEAPAIIYLEEVQEMNRFLAFCLMKGIPYQLASDKKTNVRPHLQKALQTLKASSADRLPKTYNLLTAWKNADSALAALHSSPPPELVASNPKLRGMPFINKFRIPAESCHRLLFTFKDPFSRTANSPCLELVRFVYDGKMIGSSETGDYASALRVHTLSGIHIVRSFLGAITAIRVRDGQNWSEWLGTPQAGASDSEHEWDSPKKDLIFNYNRVDCRIFDISVKSRAPNI